MNYFIGGTKIVYNKSKFWYAIALKTVWVYLRKTLFVILAYISKYDLYGESVLFQFFTEIILRKCRFKCMYSGVKGIVKTALITEARLGVNRRLRGHRRPAAEIMQASFTLIDWGLVLGRDFHERYIEIPSDKCRKGFWLVQRGGRPLPRCSCHPGICPICHAAHE